MNQLWESASRQDLLTEVARQKARAEQAEADVEGLKSDLAMVHRELDVATEEGVALRAERDRLLEALKPFAEKAAVYDPEEDDDDDIPVWCEPMPTIGDLRRARAALEAGR